MLAFLRAVRVPTLDITGGAPELNPHFRYLVSAARALGVRVMDRCNLTILEQPGQEDLAEFLAANQVEVVASMPCYLEDNVDRQRGEGVFDGQHPRAAEAQRARLRRRRQRASRSTSSTTRRARRCRRRRRSSSSDYKRIWASNYGIVFNQLYTLANMPIQRFGSDAASRRASSSAYLDSCSSTPTATTISTA